MQCHYARVSLNFNACARYEYWCLMHGHVRVCVRVCVFCVIQRDRPSPLSAACVCVCVCVSGTGVVHIPQYALQVR